MLSNISIYIFSLISFLGIQSAQPEQDITNDPKAKVILDKVNTSFKGSTGIQASFTQTTEVPGGKPSSKNGTVYIKGDKYRIDFDDQKIFCDQQSVWTYLKDNNEVQINDYEPNQGDITPSSIFNIYQSDFNYLKAADESISGILCHVIELAPKDKSRPYFKIKLWVDKTTSSPKKVKIFDKNGYRYIYTFKSINSKVKFDDTYFRFNKTDFPGVKIEDLRM